MSWKPDGYTSVSPYLIVRDARATLAFAAEVFGAEELRVIPRESGDGIMHAETRIDDTVVMMGEMPEAGDAHVHVYMADPDAAFARALAAGAREVQPMRRAGDGDYRGGVDDGNGTTWWLSRQEA
ncbi:VOC family protein [Roseobacter sp. HKCCA0434]|uniref:VOC family protein n=1 Tax=Roseobacter sp. HKCCA0434 TaxID=3079297 RepID=UPI0029058975|nr:VOC family protein [Roseobacter sp. HKCCA0434]